MPHVGSLLVGDGTYIGSNCTIDRGFIDDTIIGKSVMIDNQVHIGHNCTIEDLCIIAGQVGLSGSVYVEKNVRMGGDVSIKDNITIGENSIIAGASKVFNSFPKNSVIGGSPAQNLNDWKKIIASQRLNLKKQRFKANDN
jgi:UDP-3-O-[3-hydroxymyristoyl] glucosamine N-acyltransferase